MQSAANRSRQTEQKNCHLPPHCQASSSPIGLDAELSLEYQMAWLGYLIGFFLTWCAQKWIMMFVSTSMEPIFGKENLGSYSVSRKNTS